MTEGEELFAVLVISQFIKSINGSIVLTAVEKINSLAVVQLVAAGKRKDKGADQQ